MRFSRWLLCALLAVALPGNCGPRLHAAPLPPADESPLLRIEAGGPLSYVSALAWARVPETKELVLYAGGRDMTVHAWRLAQGRWTYDATSVLRIPIGPGLEVVINSIAVSADGRRVAVGGRGLIRSSATISSPSVVWPTASIGPEDRLDLGMIYVFDRQTGEVFLLRGHAGPVAVLKFSPAGNKHLVSYGEYEGQGKRHGELRVWDVETGATLTEKAGAAGPQVMNRLDVSASKPGLDDLRVALVNGLPQLELWDAGRNTLHAIPFTQFPFAVSWLSDGRLAAGRLGQVGVWAIPSERSAPIPALTAARDFQPVIGFSAEEDAVASVSAANLLSCVVQKGQGSKASLSLRTYSTQTFKQTGRLELWTGANKAPALAVDTLGEWIAVTGSEDNTLQVIDVRQLLAAPEQLKPQVLRAAGEFVSQVQFCRQGEKSGLLLMGTGGLNALNLRDGQIQAAANWKPITSDLGGLRVERNSQTLRVLQNNQLLFQQAVLRPVERAGVQVPEQITAAEVCASTPDFASPVLALATLKDGEPVLTLIDLKTGEVLRHLFGHTERIRSLAFSEGGRLLASAADDRTVSVWWLSDLGESTAGQGLIRDLEVRTEGVDADAKVIVTHDKKSRFAAGSVIESVLEPVRGQQRQVPLATARKFYRYVSDTPRGTTLRFETRTGGVRKTIPAVVDRAIDQRKPLFSVFVVSAKDNKWIAWDSVGKYVSSADGDRYVGWHFNQGDPAHPVKFATAAEYRQQNFDKDLLQKRLDDGPQFVPPPRPEPHVESSLWSEDDRIALIDARNGPDNDYFSQTRQVQLTASISEFPLNSLAGVTWQFDNGNATPCAAAEPGDWRADLTGVNWTPGPHRVTVRATTKEYPPREVVRVATVRYQRPAPGLKAVAPEMVMAARTPVSASITSELFAAGQAVKVVARHRHEGKDVAEKSWDQREPATLTWEVDLLPGENYVDWTAVNDAPLASFERFETASQHTTIRYRVPKRPEIRVTSVFEGDEPVVMTPGQPVRVGSPVIRLIGIIVTEGLLTSAQFGEATGELKSLPEFNAGRAEYKFEQEVRLTPGTQHWKIEARSDSNGVDDIRLETRYIPNLPTLAEISVRAEESGPDLRNGSILAEGRELPRVFVTCQLKAPNKFQPRDITVTPLVNGSRRASTVIAVPAEGVKYSAQVDLQPGDNRIELELKDEWTPKVELLRSVTYIRPPRVVALTVPASVDSPFVNLVAEVESPDDPLSRIEVLVNDNPVASLDKAEFPARGGVECREQPDHHWTVKANNIAIPAGAVKITLAARNSSGYSLPLAKIGDRVFDARATTRYAAPPKPPEKARLKLHFENSAVSSAEFQIRFRVQSETPLTSVRIRHGREERRLKLPESMGRDVEFTEPVPLLEGENTITVEAENAGGSVSDFRVINRLPVPSVVAIDRLIDVKHPDKPVLAVKTSAGLQFPALDSGTVRIQGHLDQQIAGVQFLRVWANGFLSVATIEQGKFDVQINLNRASNEIVLELPNQPSTVNSQLRCLVDTRQPDRTQNLHVVILGVTEDPEKLRKQVLAAFSSASEVNSGESPAGSTSVAGFKGVRDYVISGEFNDGVVRARMNRIRALMNTTANNVLLVCYAGEESVNASGEIELSTTTRRTIRSTHLNNMVVNAPGAHLLFIDATRSSADNKVVGWPEWPADPRLGLFRLVWSTPAHDDQRLPAALARALHGPTGARVPLESIAVHVEKEARQHTHLGRADNVVPKALADLTLVAAE